MNIIEAAKSGKRFRRTGRENWSAYRSGLSNYFSVAHGDLLADDWEVEDKEVIIAMGMMNLLSFSEVKFYRTLSSFGGTRIEYSVDGVHWAGNL